MLKYCFALIFSMILQISDAQNTTELITTTTTRAPTISIVPGCTSCFSSTASQTSSSSATSPNSITTHENQVIIIASSVSAGGLLVVVSFLICCLYRRKHKRAEMNYRSRNITKAHTEIDEKEVFSSLNNETVKKYNISKEGMLNGDNDDDDDERQRENSLPTPPVILYSDIMKKKEEEENMKREKDGRDLISRTSAVSNGTRLSKYNFLAQAFSQMRESYSAGATQKIHDFEVDNTHPQDIQNPSNMPKPEPSRTKDSAHRTFHDSMVLTQYDFDDRKQRPVSIPESIQTFTKSSTPDIRESTMTMATLHAPLFTTNGFQHPIPSSSPHLYQTTSITPNRHLYRDSVVSDVSQYSTWPVRRSTTPDEDILQEETGTLHKPIKL